MNQNKGLLEYKSFRELADEYHGPANAWHLIKTRLAELEDALDHCYKEHEVECALIMDVIDKG